VKRLRDLFRRPPAEPPAPTRHAKAADLEPRERIAAVPEPDQPVAEPEKLEPPSSPTPPGNPPTEDALAPGIPGDLEAATERHRREVREVGQVAPPPAPAPARPKPAAKPEPKPAPEVAAKAEPEKAAPEADAPKPKKKPPHTGTKTRRKRAGH